MATTIKEVKINGTMEEKTSESIITAKEVFERVVQLETKFDLEIGRGRRVAKYFWTLMFLLSFFQIATFVIHYLIYIK